MSNDSIRRRYPDAPLVGVAAAVFDDAGRVLLVQRGRPPRAGSWGLPGGLLEVGERLVDGVQREVREECGVEIDVGAVAGVFEPITRDAAGRIEYHYVVIDFWARWVSGEAQAQDDAAAIAWVALDALDLYDLSPDSRRVVEQAHAMWVDAGCRND
ncbi:MAG TPA: NUDIX hydrolase [Chloroflexi bacterium]|nr:NUDIX hydrolase [Chloroflexota bacterium]HHW89005.1 NUDIX hydrolase [Chloroflexota bacterium]